MSNKYHKDEEHLNRIRNDDESKVKEIFLDCRDPFLSYFLKHPQLDRALVFDFYLESFTRFHEKVKSGAIAPPLEGSINSILIAFGKNVVKQHWDKKNRDRMDFNIDEELTNMPPTDDHDHIDEDLMELIRKLINRLGPKCRELITLRYLKEFAYDAIANRLNIASENAARQQTFQCLKKLRNLLNE